MKYRKKPVVVEAMAFEEFIQYGLNQPECHVVDGKPWSFKINGRPVTHENNECYIITTLEGSHNMTPKDMLIIGVQGEAYPCKIDIFNETYEKVEG